MPKATKHWTAESIDRLASRVRFDFITQIEMRLDETGISRTQFADKLGVSRARVSQIMNAPSNLTLQLMLRCAKALGMKMAAVAYDDDDAENEHGPINSQVFETCWFNKGKPRDFWALKRKPASMKARGK